MATYLFVWSLLRSCAGQVIPLCQHLSECSIGQYCDNTYMCSTCNYVTPETCDALGVECCSDEFLRHCVTNPHNCPPPPPAPPSMNQGLFMFNVILAIVSVSYLTVGIYINKYLRRLEGLHILPHYTGWVGLYGLVKDGIHFTRVRCGSARADYDSLE
jgi:hypothetical protein